MKTGYRGRAALAQGRAPGNQGGRGRPCLQSHVGGRTPNVYLHRLTPDGVGASAPTLRILVPPRRRFAPRNVVMRDIDDCGEGVDMILAWQKDGVTSALAGFVECCRRELSGPVAG